ncbi:RHOD [Musa troglodytarum]|uniref:RHOD n=1 Tax=Musa troglodytarum TaxID=320322 RepID=A0A9E7EUP8_9LILI|nr:RHOD [Musa troglodytarum]
MSSCFLRSSLRLRLFSLLRRSEPTMAAAHPFAPHRTARPHVPYAALRQRPTLFRYYGCVAEVAAEPRSVPVTVVHERRQGPILLRSMSSNANAEEAVMPRSVPVAVAHELLTAGHRYLDVRTLKEFIGGHAVGAVNIPYMLEVLLASQMLQVVIQHGWRMNFRQSRNSPSDNPHAFFRKLDGTKPRAASRGGGVDLWSCSFHVG